MSQSLSLAALLETAASKFVSALVSVLPPRDITHELLEAAASHIEAAKPDSDSYLLDQVFPVISDAQLAAVVGIHGFFLIGDLVVDPRTQQIDGVLQHQEKELDVALTIRGSYARPRDGEWSVTASPMRSTEEPLVGHGTFDYDPETDAVAVMKALASLLGELAGDDAEEAAEVDDQQTPSSQGPQSPPTSSPGPGSRPQPVPPSGPSPGSPPAGPPPPKSTNPLA